MKYFKRKSFSGSDERQEEDEYMLLICVHNGEYLCSEKEERPNLCVRNRMDWERDVAELTAEGSDAFQQMYRMVQSILNALHYNMATDPSLCRNVCMQSFNEFYYC